MELLLGAAPELRTERLLLRRWQASDLDPCAAMNADPRVMEHFPALLSRLPSGDPLAPHVLYRLESSS